MKRGLGSRWSVSVWVVSGALGSGSLAATTEPPGTLPPTVSIEGDGIAGPLTAALPDAQRGRSIVANRQLGLCLLCHTGPIPEERFQGNLAPSLAGAGTRYTAAQLRLRLVNPRHLNPATVMPAYYQTQGLTRVAAQWKDKPILDAQQLEDVVAYLGTLRE